MQQHVIDMYLEYLRDVKERGNVFQAFSRGTINAIYEEATVEVATLQLQKILELLAFGFVLACGEKAIPAYSIFVKYKNVKEYFSRLSEINELFYPQPVIQDRNEQGETQWSYPAPDEYLTPEDFAILFEHCEGVLQPRHVGADPMSLEQCKIANLRWYSKIVRLLDANLVRPESSDVTYLFQMRIADALPTCNPFKMISGNIPKKVDMDRDLNHGVVTLKDHLCRQLEFLRRSCDLYDAGHLDEAIRLAVGIRVLIHDTGSSKSLLQQMGVKEQVKLATSFGFSETLPKNFQPTSIFPVFANSAAGGTSVPFPLRTPPILMAVNEWWGETLWMQESTLTRGKIILDTANKEGGAHVQANAPVTIQDLRRGLSQLTSVKINGVEVGTPENYHFILIRQFAHELLQSESLASLARAE